MSQISFEDLSLIDFEKAAEFLVSLEGKRFYKSAYMGEINTELSPETAVGFALSDVFRKSGALDKINEDPNLRRMDIIAWSYVGDVTSYRSLSRYKNSARLAYKLRKLIEELWHWGT